MKLSSLIIASSIFSLFSHTALAAMDIRGERTSFYERNKPKPIGFNYTYIDATYRQAAITNSGTDDETSKSLGAELSIHLTQQISTLIKLSGGTQSINNSSVESADYSVGAKYSHPLSKTTDIYGSLLSINSVYKNLNTNLSTNQSGYSLVFGLRQKIKNKNEWGASLAYEDIVDNTYSRINAYLASGLDDETQYKVALEQTNSDNKQSAILFTVRFNF